jgi:hypothetical protein
VTVMFDMIIDWGLFETFRPPLTATQAACTATFKCQQKCISINNVHFILEDFHLGSCMDHGTASSQQNVQWLYFISLPLHILVIRPSSCGNTQYLPY